MSATAFFGILASAMGVAMALAPLFQVRRVLERESGRRLAGVPCGDRGRLELPVRLRHLDGDPYLIIPNTLGVITNVGTLLVVRRYQQRSGSSLAP